MAVANPRKPIVRNFTAFPGTTTTINFNGTAHYCSIQNRSSNTIPVYLDSDQAAYTLAASSTLTIPDTHINSLTFGDLADVPYVQGSEATTAEISGGLVAGGRVGNGLATSGASAIVSLSVIAGVKA